MLSRLLALALAAAPTGSRPIEVFPLHAPSGHEAQAQALFDLISTRLRARGLEVKAAASGSNCEGEACLAQGSGAAVAPSWTALGEGVVLTAAVRDDRVGQGTFSAAVTAKSEGDLPRAAKDLADAVAEHLEAPVAARSEQPTFGLAFEVGDTLGSLAKDAPLASGFNLRFDVEIDYLAAPQFWPFIDLSLVLARDASGQRVQLIPILLGAKYVFRHDKSLRPFSGMALGLDFLTRPIDSDTGSSSSFAVYGVGGVDWMLLSNLALVAEASLNLNGLEASSGSGVLFALGFNLGARVLF